MSRYTDYNGQTYDYDLDSEVLDNGRLYNKKWGIMNPNISDDTEFETEHFDPDCWD